MKKNAFTLIELLAVIIILAIIALIATPIILNVIDEAKISAGKSEANMILGGINNYCATEAIKEEMDENYTTICKNTMTEEEVKKMVNLGNAEILEIEYGTKLTWLKVKSNGIIYSLQDNTMIEGDLTKPEAKYEVGDLLKVQVSESETQNIYVLEVNGDEIVGILDRNLGSPVAWISEEDYKTVTGSDLQNDFKNNPNQLNQNLNTYGPVTANKALNERTSSWNKVTKKYLPDAQDILKLTEYYKELEISGETSNWESKYLTDFFRFWESNEEVMNCSSGSECREAMIAAGGAKYLLPEWITINLKTIVDSGVEYGYWTSTPLDNSIMSNPYCALIVLFNGYPFFIQISYSDAIGVRPVIHISQSNILEKI